jgi:hypothetical protein
MKARFADGGAATVTDVLIRRSDHTAQYVVLSANGYFGPDVLVPFSAVWRVDDAVHLAVRTDEIAALQRYNHYEHCKASGLCSRSVFRYGASRPLPRYVYSWPGRPATVTQVVIDATE